MTGRKGGEGRRPPFNATPDFIKGRNGGGPQSWTLGLQKGGSLQAFFNGIGGGGMSTRPSVPLDQGMAKAWVGGRGRVKNGRVRRDERRDGDCLKWVTQY